MRCEAAFTLALQYVPLTLETGDILEDDKLLAAMSDEVHVDRGEVPLVLRSQFALPHQVNPKPVE